MSRPTVVLAMNIGFRQEGLSFEEATRIRYALWQVLRQQAVQTICNVPLDESEERGFVRSTDVTVELEIV